MNLLHYDCRGAVSVIVNMMSLYCCVLRPYSALGCW